MLETSELLCTTCCVI